MKARRTTALLTVAATTALMAWAGPAAARAGGAELISATRTGAESDSSSRQAISTNGRYIAFESESHDMVAAEDSNVAMDVFLRDRWTDTTTRVSLSAAGGETNGGSGEPAISGSGRYVAFDSFASDVVPGDTNESTDVFVLDRSTGVTTRVSQSSARDQANGRSADPAISLSGRYVAFRSDATNLVPGDTSEITDVFVHDRWTGVTTRESVGAAGEADATSVDVAISADGRHVGFSSYASNLVPGDSNDTIDVFVRDRLAKVTTRVNVSSSGVEAAPWTESYGVGLSADGRYVVYESMASNLVPGDTNNRSDIFRRDVRTGITSRVSVSNAGEQADGPSFITSITADGQRVAFGSYATNLVPGDTTTINLDVFVRDVRAGTTTAVNVGNSPTISADGRQVAFISGSDVFVARSR